MMRLFRFLGMTDEQNREHGQITGWLGAGKRNPIAVHG
jgi:hypothetical protein